MELVVLRLVHILGAIFWVGSAVFMTFFLAPTLVEAGPAAGHVMAGLQKRGVHAVIAIVAVLTILSGARLMWIASGGFSRAYFASGMGHTLGIGAAAAIVAFAIGMTIVRPAGARLGTLGTAMGAATDEAQRSQLFAQMNAVRKRMQVAGLIVTTLIILAAAAMSIARYVG